MAISLRQMFRKISLRRPIDLCYMDDINLATAIQEKHKSWVQDKFKEFFDVNSLNIIMSDTIF